MATAKAAAAAAVPVPERVSIKDAAKVIAALKGAGVGQSEMAKVADINTTTVWGWANGRGKTAPGVKVAKLVELARSRGLQLDLFGASVTPIEAARKGPKAAKAAQATPVAPPPVPAVPAQRIVAQAARGPTLSAVLLTLEGQSYFLSTAEAGALKSALETALAALAS